MVSSTGDGIVWISVSGGEERRGEERRGEEMVALILSCLVLFGWLNSGRGRLRWEGAWGMVKDGRCRCRCRRNKDPGQIYPCKMVKRSKYLHLHSLSK